MFKYLEREPNGSLRMDNVAVEGCRQNLRVIHIIK